MYNNDEWIWLNHQFPTSPTRQPVLAFCATLATSNAVECQSICPLAYQPLCATNENGVMQTFQNDCSRAQDNCQRKTSESTSSRIPISYLKLTPVVQRWDANFNLFLFSTPDFQKTADGPCPWRWFIWLWADDDDDGGGGTITYNNN